MKKSTIMIVLLTIPLALAGCKVANTGDKNEKYITISAAASLKEPLVEMVPGFEEKNKVKVDFNFGGSGTLQKQIEEGAPVDIFISAGKSQMDALEKNKFIESSTRRDILENDLVLVYSNSIGKINSIEELISRKVTLAIGEVKTVPAGQYAKQSLEAMGFWDKVSGTFIYAKDVKEVLRYVEKGEVQAGFVYNSDTASLSKDYSILKIPDNTHEPIVYSAAVISSSKEKELSKAFIDFIQSSKNKEIFNKYKFKVKE